MSVKKYGWWVFLVLRTHVNNLIVNQTEKVKQLNLDILYASNKSEAFGRMYNKMKDLSLKSASFPYNEELFNLDEVGKNKFFCFYQFV